MILEKFINEDFTTDKSRKFLVEVRKLAKKYGDLDFFIVTNNASMYNNKGNEAVRNARDKHIEWEKANGHDPYEDWGK